MLKNLSKSRLNLSSYSCPELSSLSGTGLTIQKPPQRVLSSGFLCIPTNTPNIIELKWVTPKNSVSLQKSWKEQPFYKTISKCNTQFFKTSTNQLRVFSGDVEGDYGVILHLLSSVGVYPSGKVLISAQYL